MKAWPTVHFPITASMAELKTFVFTDLADSVRLKDEMPGQNATERDQAFIETILSPHREHIERELYLPPVTDTLSYFLIRFWPPAGLSRFKRSTATPRS